MVMNFKNSDVASMDVDVLRRDLAISHWKMNKAIQEIVALEKEICMLRKLIARAEKNNCRAGRCQLIVQFSIHAGVKVMYQHYYVVMQDRIQRILARLRALQAPVYDSSQSAAVPFRAPYPNAAAPFNGPYPSAAGPFNGPPTSAAGPFNGPSTSAAGPFNGPSTSAPTPFNGPSTSAAAPFNGPYPSAAAPFNGPSTSAAASFNGPSTSAAAPFHGPSTSFEDPHGPSHSTSGEGSMIS